MTSRLRPDFLASYRAFPRTARENVNRHSFERDKEHLRDPARRIQSGRRAMDPTIPESHIDLVDCPPVAAMTTVMPDGYPQTSVVWCDFDGTYVRVNTMRGFQKERNMRRDPRVTLLCYDPRQPLRSLEVRGVVAQMTEEDAGAHLDAISSRYAGRAVRYFGDVIPARFAETEIPVLCLIRPTHVVALDATGS